MNLYLSDHIFCKLRADSVCQVGARFNAYSNLFRSFAISKPRLMRRRCSSPLPNSWAQGPAGVICAILGLLSLFFTPLREKVEFYTGSLDRRSKLECL